MRRLPKPIVALVEGRALAGGCGLATACDLVLAAESARFGYPEVQRGFVPAHAVLAVPTIALGVVLTFGATAREGLVALVAVLAGLGLAAAARPRARPRAEASP